MGFLEKLGFKTADQDKRLKDWLEMSRNGLLTRLGRAIAGKDRIDEEVLDELEEVLITSDVGVKTTLEIIRRIEARVNTEKYLDSGELHRMLRQEIIKLLKTNEAERPAAFDAPLPNSPHVVLVVGVNGVGKTTTIGKLAAQHKAAGRSVLLGAADTFRAAAVQQLTIWSERAGVPIIQQGQDADPAAVAFDSVSAAKSRGAAIVIIDTAGRLHNKTALMAELGKINRVMANVIPDAHHEILLVLDASTGQNAMQQAKAFTEAVPVTGLALTKLDGTAKGGIVIGISSELAVPVKYVGVGEGIADLQVFDREAFVNALFEG